MSDKKLIIKVCGMRDADNMAQVESLGIDMMGGIYYPKSPRYINAPGHSNGFQLLNQNDKQHKSLHVGVFVNEMPQNIITAVYNDQLDAIQLHGNEPATEISNLRATLVPDVRKQLLFIKAISINNADDIARCAAYDGVTDYLLFDTKCTEIGGSGRKFNWDILSLYHGNTPFLLSGGLGPGDESAIRQFSHPAFAGIDLNSRFETQPAVKDVELLSQFIQNINM